MPVNGKQISFKAPCSCKETSGLEIDGQQYTVVDALGHCVTGRDGRWAVGSIVSVILDTEKKYAYIQNETAALTYFSDLKELGITKGDETMSSIAKAMPDHSELWLMINTADGYNDDDDVYPVSSGTLIVRRREARRITFDFYPTSTADASSTWYGYANANTGYFSKWKEQKDATSVYGPHNKPSNSYTGNGKARTINTSGTGNVLAIWHLYTSDTATGSVTEPQMAFVTPLGLVGNIYDPYGDGWVKHLSDQIKFENGVLTIAGSVKNNSGITYYYQVL